MNEPKPTALSPGRLLVRKGIASAISIRSGSRIGRKFELAVLKLDRLGDFVLAVSAIREVISSADPSRTLLIVSPWAAPLARVEFPEVEILVLPGCLGTGQMARQARKIRKALLSVTVSKVVCFRHHRTDYDEVVLSLLGAPLSVRVEDRSPHWRPSTRRTFRFKGPGLVVLESPSKPLPGQLPMPRELELHRQLLSAVMGRSVDPDRIAPALHTCPHPARPLDLVIAPFGSSPIRDVPVTHLSAILNCLDKESCVHLMGLPSQELRLRSLAGRVAGHGHAIDVLLPDGFEEYLGVLADASLVVSPETATAHIRTAFDRPGLFFLGGGHFGQFAPWSRSGDQIWLDHETECRGCDWACHLEEPECLTHLPVRRTTEAVRRLRGLTSKP